MIRELAGFKFYLSTSKTTKEHIVGIITYGGNRIGAIRAFKISPEDYPCIGDNIYYAVDLFEMIESKGIHCIADTNNFESRKLIVGPLGEFIHTCLLKQVTSRGGSLIYNFTAGVPVTPITVTRELWNWFVEEGKATLLDPDLPLIVMPPVEPDLVKAA